jgi:outer membrane protein OmpA-like peptidoglycan-associated protein
MQSVSGVWCLAAVLLLLGMLSGCASKTTVVLVPDPEGRVGAVTVANDAGEVSLTREREAADVRGRQTDPGTTEILSEAKVQRKFAQALESTPRQPVHFILYFRTDSVDLAAPSRASLTKVVTAIRDNRSTDISSIGHSDTAGDPGYNLKLSQQRAQEVARLLIQAGVEQKFLEVTSHGERNPIIKTGDNVSEKRNRRVEVVVR